MLLYDNIHMEMNTMNTIYIEMIFNDLIEKVDDIRIKTYKYKNH